MYVSVCALLDNKEYSENCHTYQWRCFFHRGEWNRRISDMYCTVSTALHVRAPATALSTYHRESLYNQVSHLTSQHTI